MNNDGYVYGPDGQVYVAPLISDFTKYTNHLNILSEDTNTEVSSAASIAVNKLWQLENKKISLVEFDSTVPRVKNNLDTDQSARSYNYIIDRLLESYEGKR